MSRSDWMLEKSKRMKGENRILMMQAGEALDAIEKVPIYISDVEACDVHSDAGGKGLTWNCPICGNRVVWAPGGWWEVTCECDRNWRVEISAIGEPKP